MSCFILLLILIYNCPYLQLIHRVVFVAAVILRAAHVDTSTHWIVTEDGKLQEQVINYLCDFCQRHREFEPYYYFQTVWKRQCLQLSLLIVSLKYHGTWQLALQLIVGLT